MMPRKQKNELAVIPLENSDGQFTIFTDIPDIVQKAHGPVVDSVMSQALDSESTVLIDDTYEIHESLPIATRVMLSYQNMGFQVQSKHHLDAFDREVMDAVATLALDNQVITDANILQVITGRRSHFKATPKQLAHVQKSMDALIHCVIKIDITDMFEADSRIGKKLKKYGLKTQYTGPLMAVETYTVTNGQKSICCYRIFAQSALVRYARALGKVSEFPIEILDTCVSKTERNIILQAFLLRSIDSMYRGEIDPFIEAGQIYAAAGIEKDPRQVKERLRVTVHDILEDWKGKGYIKGYTARKAGNITRGYAIALSDLSQPEALPPAPSEKTLTSRKNR